MPFPPASHVGGTVHHYHPKLIAYEWPSREDGPTLNSRGRDNPYFSVPSYLIFIGGLGDNLFSVRYVNILAHLLPAPWRLIQIQLSSSGTGYGISSLQQDAKEIGQLVNWLYDSNRGPSNSTAKKANNP